MSLRLPERSTISRGGSSSEEWGAPRSGEVARQREQGWRFRWVALPVVGLVLLAVLTQSPGWYVADARFEQFWAPARFLARHTYAWSAVRDLGGPAPYYSPVVALFLAAVRAVGASPALAERLLHGAYLTVGAWGMAEVLRLFRPRRGPEHLLAALLFAFNPYTSQFLLPSGLFLHYAIAPWLVVAVVRGVRGDPWRWGAVFALAIFSVGAINTASLIYAATPLVPAVLYVVAVDRSASWRRVIAFAARALFLTVLVSAGAMYQGALVARTVTENLSTTELPQTVSRTSAWSESWRGLGFWLTYFPWPGRLNRAEVVSYFTRWDVILATFLVPLAALAALWKLRWRPRVFFAATMIVALVFMVGMYPPSDPSPLGRLLGSGYDRFLILRGMRSGYKAGVGWAIGVAALAALAAVEGVRWYASRGRAWGARQVRGVGASALVILVAGTASFPFWTGNLYSRVDRVKAVPAYWRHAVEWLDDQPAQGGVLILPGVNRARYRWGYPGDDIFDALLRRPHVEHSSISQSTPEAADLVATLDRHAAGRDYVPGAIAPIARRLGIRWIVLRNDLAWERLDLPRPAGFRGLRDDPDLSLLKTFGRRGQNTVPARAGRVLSEEGERNLPPVEIYWVRGVHEPTRLVDNLDPLLVSGNGDAWLPLAASGSLDGGSPIRYTADLSSDATGNLLTRGARLVVTDTNRRRLTRVTSTRTYVSETLTSSQHSERPPVRLFSRPGSDSVATYPDATQIEASAYGDGLHLFPTWLRPANAFDGDPATAWQMPVLGSRGGAWIRVDFRRPRRVQQVTLEPLGGVPRVQRIRRVLIRLSGDHEVIAVLGTGPTTVRLPPRVTRSLEVRVLRTSGTGSTLGFREITVPGADLRERIRATDDVFRQARRDRPLAVQLARTPVAYEFRRAEGSGSQDEEVALRRDFVAAGSRSYDLIGNLRLGPSTPDSALDGLLGGPVGAAGSSRYLGALDTAGRAAVDGNLATSWQVAPTVGESLRVRFPKRPVASVDVYTVVDRRTRPRLSRATEASIRLGDEPSVYRVDLRSEGGCLPAGDDRDLCVQRHRVALPGSTVDSLTVELAGFDPAPGLFGALPVRIAEVAVGGFRPPVLFHAVPSPTGRCVPLVTLDGRALPARLLGQSARVAKELETGQPVTIRSCEPARLSSGTHHLDSTSFSHGAIDRIQLATGAPTPPNRERLIGGVLVLDRSPTRVRMLVNSPQGGVLFAGPTFARGWTATITGGRNLGRAQPLDTLSGWEVPSGTYQVIASYRPQRSYEAALAVSGAGLAVCLVLVLRRRTS